MSTPSTEALLRDDWDAIITYDVLETSELRAGVFVGRDDLLRPLEASVIEADKRGTILVSGYRGSGKTTLVIEALRRAAVAFRKVPEENRPRLLPVVLNVSEVSTSLSTPDKEATLKIDPRRLLVALLRAFRQRVDRFEKNDPLRDQIDLLYRKATAAAFKLAQNSGRSRESIRQQESGWKIDSADLLKSSLFPAGLVSLGLASLGATQSIVDQTVKAVAAVGSVGAATLGVVLNRTRTEKATDTSGVAVSYEHDNSQQELENDLKDLLQALRDNRWRTVIVLEELDKLDGQGEELDSVIRYFKNLFTQSPALFIFVTDKAYYDRIGRNIRHARRERTYAVEHTFFTHRMFVGRPSTHDCLSFVRALLRDPADQQVIDTIYGNKGRWAVESYGPRNAQPGAVASPLSLFVRVLLFRASNHLFDLKAELQRFVRTGTDGPRLCFDLEMFPPEDQVLAKFQDLLADKARTFEIKGGRGYANEVLHDCLAGVFYDLGSARQRLESELLVGDAPDGRDGPLEPGERKRVNAAVVSLLEDLASGGALRRIPAGTTPAAVEWLDKPADAFSLVRRLDAHEEKFAGELRQLANRARQLETFAPAHAFAPLAAKLAQDFAARADAVSDLDTKVSVDDALKNSREATESFGRLVAQANDAISNAAAQLHSLAFESLPVGSREPGEGARLLMTVDGDPRSQPPPSNRGLVILAEGAREAMLTDVRALVEQSRPQRVAVVCLASHFTADEATAWRDKWVATLTGLPAWAQGVRQQPRIRVLGREQLSALASDPATNTDPAVDRAPLVLARELIAAAVWAVRPRTFATVSRHDGVRFGPPVAAWLALENSPDSKPVLVSQLPAFPRLAHAVRDALWSDHADAPWCIPLPNLGSTGDIADERVRSELESFLVSILSTPTDTTATRNERTDRVIELLAGEAGIVVSDIEPPSEENILFPILSSHRWVMPDNGLILSRIERRGSEDIKLNGTDTRTPPDTTFSVPTTWGLYRPAPRPAEGDIPSTSVPTRVQEVR